MTRRGLALLLALSACGPTKAGPGNAAAIISAPTDGALPAQIAPVSATLAMNLDPQRPDYSGTVTYTLDLAGTTDRIWLHQRGLEVRAAHVQTGDAKLPIDPAHIGASDELLTVELPRRIGPGRATLSIDFRGKYGDRVGVFRQAIHGNTRFVVNDKALDNSKLEQFVYTDFEPTDARAGFPSFDEPRWKHPWTITITTPKGLAAFANSPRAGSRDDGDRTVHTFAQSKPLPSYLVAFAAGDFVVDTEHPSLPIRVIKPRNMAGSGADAVRLAGAMVPLLERWMGQPIPYAKTDFIAVPSLGGAMENPGLITYRADWLLGGADPSGLRAGVVAHELAHLYFGDLVTPTTWNDLWFNEGFATWMSVRLAHAVEPALEKRTLYVADVGVAYPFDVRLGARPLRPKRAPDRLEDLFDPITYRKGGAVIGMLERWYGTDVLDRALAAHLRGRAHGHTTAAELVDDLVAAAPARIGEKRARAFFDSFLGSAGIPQVQFDIDCGTSPAKLTVSQTRLSRVGEKTPGDPSLWTIPMCVRYPGAKRPQQQCLVLDDAQTTVPLEVDMCPRSFDPNPGAHGYYVPVLDRKYSRALSRTAGASRITGPAVVRWLRARWSAGQISLADLVHALEPLHSSGNDTVAEEIAELVTYMSRAVPDSPANKELLRRALGPVAWPAKPSEMNADRSKLALRRAMIAARLGDLDMAARAEQAATAELAGTRTVNPGDLFYVFLASNVRGPARSQAILQMVRKRGRRLLGLAQSGALAAAETVVQPRPASARSNQFLGLMIGVWQIEVPGPDHHPLAAVAATGTPTTETSKAFVEFVLSELCSAEAAALAAKLVPDKPHVAADVQHCIALRESGTR